MTDGRGNRIEVRRVGYVDKNRYARLTPLEKSMRDNTNNKNYKPGESQ